MLKIAIFGAGGQAGTAAVIEASARGHHVTALRRADADITNPQAVARAAFGQDVAIGAVAPADGDPAGFYRAAASSLAAGLVEAGVDRLVWVSIASLLPNAAGVAPVDAEGFPAEYRPFSLGHRAALEVFTGSDLIWTAVSPAGDFDPHRSPQGGYTMTAVGDLSARITYADHARAIVDLAEQPGVRGGHVGVLPPSPGAPAEPGEGGAARADRQ
ncbi:NAD(P)-dependent oxidoreductase [Saccharopolyspora elongata]|uniref:NAD(P)-dependent oxidoreductase n=1 Tax=Saccharopolyspora elongata TaxID=2530387 RepID=UPI001A9CFE8B|nr:NAD(P)H-binding protein [Saccharopolyspora elongata]